MWRRILFLVAYFFAWVLLFELARLLFIVYHFSFARALPLTENIASFWYGLRMDFSMASYLLLPVCLFALASVWLPYFRKVFIYLIYSALLLFFFLLITIADLEVYRQWGFRIDATPLKYLSSPAEAWASVSHLPLVWYAFAFLAMYILLVFIFSRWLNSVCILLANTGNKWLSGLAVLCFMPILIIPLRGGFQQAPLNQSNVYFSNHAFANHAAINASWNFLHGITNHTGDTENPYHYFSYNKAKSTVDSAFMHQGYTTQLLNTTHPNIVLIIWESFTAKALSQIIEGKAITPYFNQLKDEGIYFSNVWASGDRTDKGLAAILSGYPALPASSIIRTPSKASSLATITQVFNQKGYATPFYYGGEAAFANIKSYLLHAGYHPIIEKNSFSAADQNSKWGAHDGVVATRLSSDLNKIKQPFFATWLTLSSHEPFEVPTAYPFTKEDDETKFLASVQYTDAVLGQWIEQSKKQTWWKNTLVIIIADHGHVYPKSEKLDNFAIPMLWLGGTLKKESVRIDKVASQLDVAATLLAQTGNGYTQFPFSKNILDSTAQPWAFFSFNNGFGLVQPHSQYVFDGVGKQVIMQNGAVSNHDLYKGKSMRQVFYQDYLDK